MTRSASSQLGIQLGQGFILPFPVTINIDPRIGGPSAGLMFSLGIYDTLTPGSLTDGGESPAPARSTPTGKVGPIGGIQQKIVGARDAGAQLFLVPADNCDDAKGAPERGHAAGPGRHLRAPRESIEAWVEDHDAELPELRMSDA